MGVARVRVNESPLSPRSHLFHYNSNFISASEAWTFEPPNAIFREIKIAFLTRGAKL